MVKLASAPRRALRRTVEGIVSIANRLSFVIGRDPSGRWVAMEEHGLAGGIFKSKEAALHYAVAECGHRPGAVRVARRPVRFPA